MSEKILSSKAGRTVSAGENVIVKVDYAFTHDASGPLVISQLKELGMKVHDPDRVIFIIDHAVPSPRVEISNDQDILRRFAKEAGAHFFDAGGICHQLIAENFANPGDVIIGSDSHTCTAGALGSFATGLGATDIAIGMGLGKNWFRVPESIKIVVDGTLQKGVYSKDVVLYTIGRLGADGATYKTLEFLGSGVKGMDISERLTLTNMAVEAGAKTGLTPTDERTREYLAVMGRGDRFIAIEPDEDAIYESEMVIDARNLPPMVALPHAVDNVKPVDQVVGEKIDLVFIGSCTNARIEDLRLAAGIIKGRALKTRLIVTPASRRIYREAMKDGTLDTFMEAGAVVTPPGCGLCFGALGGVPADKERILATSNRNFKGRTGNPNAFTYLASPALAAATAIEGKIVDPRDYV